MNTDDAHLLLISFIQKSENPKSEKSKLHEDWA
jgi:hypothetical protein